MKQIFTLLVSLIFTGAIFSQDCNIGNMDGTNPDFVEGNFQANYLGGVNFTLSEIGILHSLNMFGNGTGTSIKMAIYDDLAGAPNNLIAQTAVGVVETGIVSLSVSEIELQAGDYWIMAIYDTNGVDSNQSNINTSDPNSEVFYMALPFNSPIPENGAGFIGYTGQDLLYFAEISCGGLAVGDFQMENVAIYPNPALDRIHVANLKENVKFEIYNLSGKKLIERELTQLNNSIDISHLASGMYFIIGGNHTSKFVKY